MEGFVCTLYLSVLAPAAPWPRSGVGLGQSNPAPVVDCAVVIVVGTWTSAQHQPGMQARMSLALLLTCAGLWLTSVGVWAFEPHQFSLSPRRDAVQAMAAGRRGPQPTPPPRIPSRSRFGRAGGGGTAVAGGDEDDDDDEDVDGPPGWTRRTALGGTLATLYSLMSSYESPRRPADYGLWGTLPVGPYKTKRTAQLETLVADNLWTLDQKFGILDVQVPLRMVVIRLSPASGGGLWIYNPIAATQECLSQIRALETQYGPVKHLVLGSVAIEHKNYAGVFAQKFPSAQVWLQPGQYSVPVDLPSNWLGFPGGRTRVLPNNVADTPWAKDFDQATLGPLISRDGCFGETAFFHRATKTLIVTDTVVQIDERPPPIYGIDPKPLLYHARDTITQRVDPTDEAALRRGWRRIQLFGLFFMPSAIDIHTVGQALAERRPDINGDFGGIYPWDWVRDDKASFEAIRSGGTGKAPGLLVAPILQVLILNRYPVEVLEWADRVAKWDFQRIVPAHLKNDIAADGKAFRRAFTFLEAAGEPKGQPKPFSEDLQALRDAEEALVSSGAIAPRPPKVGSAGVSLQQIQAATKYSCRNGLCTPRAVL